MESGKGSREPSEAPITRVVYVVESPLTPRDAQRFGISNMKDAGFDVLVWEVSALYLPGSETGDPQRAQGVEIRRMAMLSELDYATRQLREHDLVILICGTQKRQLRSHRTLHSALGPTPARLATIVGGQLPVPPQPRLRRIPKRAEARSRLARLLEDFVALAPIATLARAWNRRRHGIRPLDWAWIGTTSTPLEPTLVAPSTRIRPIHAFDYDLVLALEPRLEPAARGVVFLDSMGPLHPDYDSLNLAAARPEADPYFAAIRRFLDHFEQALGQRVCIAAHPRAHSGTLEPWYGDREVVYGETPRCIDQSTLVILPNNTTAANLVVALGKPCLFLTSASFDPILEPYVRNLAALLHAPIYDAGQPVAAPLQTKVDQKAYARFMRDYIKLPGTPTRPFWDVVAEDIRGFSILDR